jgi:hypothetical protein
MNTERLFRGRSTRKGERASDPREAGATPRAKCTIRDHRDRSAREADRRAGEDA